MNINTIEIKEIETAKNDNLFLTKLVTLLSTIKSRRQLFNVINEHVRNHLHFNNSTIFVLNNEKTEVFNFFGNNTFVNADSPFCNCKTIIQLPNDHPAFITHLDEVKMIPFDFDETSEIQRISIYLKPEVDVKISGGLIINLYKRESVFAQWVISAGSNPIFSGQQKELLQITANLLSSALYNLRSEEIINEKDAESGLLMDFSFALTTVRDKKDLIRVVNNDLKKLFNFHGIIVMAAKPGQAKGSIFLSNGSLFFAPDNDANLMLLDLYFKKSIEKREIVTYQNDGSDVSPAHQTICIGLKETTYNISLFFSTPSVKENFSDHEIDLIKGICYQLSSIISNLLAKDEISRREEERELLLSLNYDLAAARHQTELIGVISKRLKSILGFSHIFIGKINNEEMTAGTFLLDPESIRSNHALYADLISKSYPVNDGFINKAFEHPGPKIYDLDVLNQKITLPVYLKLDYECGTKQIIVSRFTKGIHVFAFWVIYFDKKQRVEAEKLTLLEGLSNQLSITVCNIMANEEITQREHEKSRLLSFSNAITSVRDKNVLAKILKNQLRELFDIKDYVIHFLSDDKQKHTPVLFDPDANFAQCPDFKKLINVWSNVNDGIFDKILASQDPVFFDMDQRCSQPGGPDYLKSARTIQLRQMIGVSIRLGQQNIAVMNFIHDDYKLIVDKFHLFKCILSQIALTISNMMANEKVVCQLTEINNYKLQLEEEKIYLKEEIETTLNYSEMVGESAAMQKAFRLVSQVASSDSTVLILGETGTGKELIARAIHNSSSRKNKLMVKVNCAALPANLIESELFGHERGSFTGATERRLGKFELANNGTLFLDEIGEMPLELQVKLLRALQEREIERVGGRTTIKVDVRIIAATNRDLEKEMAEGRFRSDLYYRLNIFPITLPPLRERKEDIPNLALYFIQRFAKKAGREITTLHNRALQELVNYNWPGNIRELEHLIERSILLTTGDTIKQIHLPNHGQRIIPAAVEDEFVTKTIDENERDFILKTLKYCNGRIGGQSGAAQLLGVPTSTLNSKIKRLGIRKDHHL